MSPQRRGWHLCRAPAPNVRLQGQAHLTVRRPSHRCRGPYAAGTRSNPAGRRSGEPAGRPCSCGTGRTQPRALHRPPLAATAPPADSRILGGRWVRGRLSRGRLLVQPRRRAVGRGGRQRRRRDHGERQHRDGEGSLHREHLQQREILPLVEAERQSAAAGKTGRMVPMAIWRWALLGPISGLRLTSRSVVRKARRSRVPRVAKRQPAEWILPPTHS